MAENIGQVNNIKGFRVFYQHIEPVRGAGEEPCMVIGRSRRAWVIPLSRAYDYADSITGGPSPHLVKSAAAMAKLFGMYPDKSTVRAIVDIILDNLPNLLRMPPARIKDTRKIVEDAVEKDGISLSVDGKNLLS